MTYLYQHKPFELSKTFLNKYNNLEPKWGFNGLGKFVYMRTYSRIKENGEKETWQDTVTRVVNGVYNMQKKWIMGNRLVWDERKAQKSAQEMFDRMFYMKFLPPGRGLWAMGTPITEERNLFAALNNCAFISTENIKEEKAEPFCFLMDASMLGVGVGFDTKGNKTITIHAPKDRITKFIIPDSREGWVESLRLLLESYFDGSNMIEFDYSEIRPEGTPIKGFGGISSGYKPLKDLHEEIRYLLDTYVGKPITSRVITDIMNMIGKAVIAGNIRRTAEVAFGEPDDIEFLDLKNYEVNPDRQNYGWTSNNSIYAELGMDYKEAVERTKLNGEPGYAWLENMKSYSRMNGDPDNKDHRATGSNPCLPGFANVLVNRNGEKRICQFDDISIGDEIWSETGWTTVVNKWFTGEKSVYKYKTTAGYFLGTDNHKIISHGSKIEAKYADSIDILAGDVYSQTNKNLQATMDGLVIGDGSVHLRSKAKVYLTIGENDRDYFDDSVSKFIIDRHAVKYGTAWKVITTITPEELPITYLREVPERYFYADLATVAAFLRGIYSANGSVVSNRITLKSTSKKMIEQVQEMLSALGIRSYYTTNNPHMIEHRNGIYESRESYDLNISSDRHIFAEKIGFIQKYKTEKLNLVMQSVQTQNKVKTSEIIDIEYVGDFPVYDITVDNDTHTFWTSGVNVSNCLEQTLESWELCTLVETFPTRHESKEDFLRTLKFAYLYAKSITLGQTHWPNTNRVMLRNRRIGCSVSGIAQFITQKGINELKSWLEEGYETIQSWDEIYSDWFAIPRSIKTTSVKPSGTVSLLAGVTPGVHYPESRFYIRRIRVAKNSELLPSLEEAGFYIEPTVNDESSVVVEFPVDAGKGIRTTENVSMWEQLALTAFIQKYWADNQVSATITFKKDEAEMIEPALNFYQYQLKGISFLPKLDYGVFPQMPYEAITEEEYLEKVKHIKPLIFEKLQDKDAVGEKFCNNDTCLI